MPEETLPPPTAESKKTHLLVVEDEPTIRELFSILLARAGYSVAQAQDGFTALEEIRRQRPALVLSDLNMPRMTGFELISVIRRRFPSMHVIAMSGAFPNDEIPHGVAADAFYQKSGRHISTLVEVIEGILQEARSRRSSAPEAAGSAAEAENDSASEEPEVALWVTRRGTPIDGPYILLTCARCMRSFPHRVQDISTMEVTQTACVFCAAPIKFALLDPSITHHPGYAPSAKS